MGRSKKHTAQFNIEEQKDFVLPVLPLRGMVFFPFATEEIYIGRKASINAVNAAIAENAYIILLAQKDNELLNPLYTDMYELGTLAQIYSVKTMPDKTLKLVVKVIKRVKIHFFCQDELLLAKASIIDDIFSPDTDLAKLVELFLHKYKETAAIAQQEPSFVLDDLQAHVADPSAFADKVAKNLSVGYKEKQEILEIANVALRLEKLISLLHNHLSLAKLDKKIHDKVRLQIDKNQRDYYLGEQMKAIQKEMGQVDSSIQELEEKIHQAQLTKEVRKKVQNEFGKLKHMPPMSSESAVIRNYIECVLQVPWIKKTKLHTNVVKAKKVLDADHYGLHDVKEKILEYLAAFAQSKNMKASVLCLVGPPGVGKTSLGQSIAKATNRQYIRLALGGVKDEAEIRGHRRTYIGAMPGRIMQKISKVGVKNPLFLLDEIDKIGMDYRGDPASALLEVLDPEQNNAFSDHFLELEYDLSQVLFVCTSNSLDIPEALKDRLEIIYVSGYTEEEKLHIAQQHLIPKIIQEHNAQDILGISQAAVQCIISQYVREAGVRELERKIKTIVRKYFLFAQTGKIKGKTSKENKKEHKQISIEDVPEYLGVSKYTHLHAEQEHQIGQVTGLAWTKVGGELLKIEAAFYPGKGEIVLTGSLGKVMQESAKAALTVIRTKAEQICLDESFFKHNDLHIHIPEGATPKDGPSAGVALVSVLFSLITQTPIRCDVAMTGEVTIRGKVLAIGGLKEKLLAAQREGIKHVIIPHENAHQIEELPKSILEEIHLVKAKDIDDVLQIALTNYQQRWHGSDVSVDPLVNFAKKSKIDVNMQPQRHH